LLVHDYQHLTRQGPLPRVRDWVTDSPISDDATEPNEIDLPSRTPPTSVVSCGSNAPWLSLPSDLRSQPARGLMTATRMPQRPWQGYSQDRPVRGKVVRFAWWQGSTGSGATPARVCLGRVAIGSWWAGRSTVPGSMKD
jgi:hypothetical protein